MAKKQIKKARKSTSVKKTRVVAPKTVTIPASEVAELKALLVASLKAQGPAPARKVARKVRKNEVVREPINFSIKYGRAWIEVNSASIQELRAERDALRSRKRLTPAQAADLEAMEDKLFAMRQAYHAERAERSA